MRTCFWTPREHPTTLLNFLMTLVKLSRILRWRWHGNTNARTGCLCHGVRCYERYHCAGESCWQEHMHEGWSREMSVCVCVFRNVVVLKNACVLMCAKRCEWKEHTTCAVFYSVKCVCVYLRSGKCMNTCQHATYGCVCCQCVCVYMYLCLPHLRLCTVSLFWSLEHQ